MQDSEMPSDRVIISRELSEGESQAVKARKILAATTMTQKLDIDIDKDQVPVVAVLGSGGGLRAMLSLLGSIKGLQETGLLKYVTYICGVSGSTWTMSLLYDNHEWSKNLESVIEDISSKISDREISWATLIDCILEEKHLQRLVEAAKKEDYSLTDFWAVIVSCLIRMEGNHCLSQHQKYVNKGQNPYPVYAAIDEDILHPEEKIKPSEIWFEFTPYECGFPSYEAFIKTSDLGSEFENGVMTKRHPEPDLCRLQGIWGSAMADFKTSNKYIIKKLFEINQKLIDQEAVGFLQGSAMEREMNAAPVCDLLSFIQNTIDALLRWKFGTIFNYLYHLPEADDGIKTHHDVIKKRFVSLVDAALAINCAYPLMLQPKRKVDVIISLDYSDGDIFKTLNQARDYAEANHLPFPMVDTKGQWPQDCNVYNGYSTPTVIHMPLFNEANKHEATIEDYPAQKINYTREEIDKLLKIAKENVTRNKGRILKEIIAKLKFIPEESNVLSGFEDPLSPPTAT